MLEFVSTFAHAADRPYYMVGCQKGQIGIQLGGRQAGDLRKKRTREAPAQHRADLRRALGVAELVQARHERALQRVRHPLPAGGPRLEHRRAQLLNVQRVAVAA